VKTVVLALAGWLIPGGAFLLRRKYAQFGAFAILVCVTFWAGIALHGAYAWPQGAELAGLSGFDALVARAGAFTKMLAGAPYFVAQLMGGGTPWLDGTLHEYGTTLLTLAGLFNILGITTALEPVPVEAR
jgi:hypothetical protein